MGNFLVIRIIIEMLDFQYLVLDFFYKMKKNCDCRKMLKNWQLKFMHLLLINY